MSSGSENLIPFNERTEEEQREIARQGGVASGKARRAKRELRECLELLLDKEYTASGGTKISGADRISARLFRNALDGDNTAFVIIRDTVGQKPADRVEVGTIDPQARAEMDELLGLNEQ